MNKFRNYLLIVNNKIFINLITIVMFNKIKISEKLIMFQQKEQISATNQIKTQQIIEYCRLKFINIQPKNVNSNRTLLQYKSNSSPQNQLSQFNTIIYKKQQIKQVMRQLSMFLQLVIQNCLLSSDAKVKAQSYKILWNFRNFLTRDLEQFQAIIYNRNKSKLPFFQVDCREFMGQQVDLKIPPQVSLYQDPILFYIYSRFAQQQLFINHPIHVNRQERIQILKHHIPFLNPQLIPIISERLQTKSKFSQLQDRLIQILLKSKLDIGEYKHIYFPNRHQAQIKNRIKNMTCQCKEMNTNPIKELKMAEYLPITEQELQKIFKGYLRFGPRWPVIAKYYNCRSADFLQLQYNFDQKLQKRRQKDNIYPKYQSLKVVLDQRIQQINKKNQNMQVMDLQNRDMFEVIEEQKHQLKYSRASSDINSIEEEPQYKIINHLTFQYCEI